jgi:hypothetical protein
MAGRWRAEGPAGLIDRRSVPGRIPHKTPADRVSAMCALRRLRLTAAEIAECLQMPLSTVSAVLLREGLGKRSRLAAPEAPNRYERARRADPRRHQQARAERRPRPRCDRQPPPARQPHARRSVHTVDAVEVRGALRVRRRLLLLPARRGRRVARRGLEGRGRQALLLRLGAGRLRALSRRRARCRTSASGGRCRRRPSPCGEAGSATPRRPRRRPS